MPIEPNILTASVIKRASKKIFKLFNLNRFELELLCVFYAQLIQTNKDRLGIRKILRAYLINSLHPNKEIAIFYSLLSKQFIEKHTVISGINYSITNKARLVLSMFDNFVNDEKEKYK